MKSFLLALLMLPPFTTLFAQDAVGEKQLQGERRNEAGVLVEFSAASIGQNFLTGLQYKHFGKKNIGYKIFAGVGGVSTSGNSVDYLPIRSPDTSVRKYTNLNVTMPIIGVGIEGQHPLYRYVYMFAAIDVRVGYGSSKIDSTIEVTMPDNMIPRPYYGNMTIITDKSGPIAHMLYAGIATYPGIKVQLKRIAAGLDFPFLVFFTDLLKTNKADYENSDFSFSIGLFASYLF